MKIKYDRRGCLVLRTNIEKMDTAEVLIDKYKNLVDVDGDIRINRVDEISIAKTVLEKRCVVYLAQWVTKSRVVMQLAIAPMWVHDSDVVREYALELGRKLHPDKTVTI